MINKISPLKEAQTTCDGLHRLIQKISEAAVDIDKGGSSSSYEMLALIASATTCVTNLGTQLAIIESVATEESNVHPIKRTDKLAAINPTDKNETLELDDSDFDDGKIVATK